MASFPGKTKVLTFLDRSTVQAARCGLILLAASEAKRYGDRSLMARVGTNARPRLVLGQCPVTVGGSSRGRMAC